MHDKWFVHPEAAEKHEEDYLDKEKQKDIDDQ
jgi:hypothetical protein